MIKKNIKKGFTLAEILGTMTLIGVVAAMTLPVIVQARPNKELIMFRKAYAETTRIVNDLINDEDLYPDAEESGLATTDALKDFVTYFAQKMGSKGEVVTTAKTDFTTTPSFISADGMRWFIAYSADASNGQNFTIRVDVSETAGDCVSGSQNCTTPDRFRIFVAKDGRISLPVGDNDIERTYITTKNIKLTYSELKKIQDAEVAAAKAAAEAAKAQASD